MNAAKAKLRSSIAFISFQAAIDRLSAVNNAMMNARFQSSINMNPYQSPDKDHPNKQKLNPRMLRYEKALLSQKLMNMTNKEVI
jgi:hypothetical protein